MRRVTSAARRAAKHVPNPAVDLISDRVVSRSLTVAGFMVVVAFVVRLLLLNVFLRSPLRPAVDFAVDLQIQPATFAAPATSAGDAAGTSDALLQAIEVRIGAVFQPTPSVLVLGADGRPLPGVNVSAVVQDVFASPQVASVREHAVGEFTALDWVGFPDATLHRYVSGGLFPRPLREPLLATAASLPLAAALQGTQPNPAMTAPVPVVQSQLAAASAVSDANGVATFAGLHVFTGVPGVYGLRFTAGLAQAFTVLRTTSTVGRLVVVAYGRDGSPLRATGRRLRMDGVAHVGRVLPSLPTVRVVDAAGQPVPNKRVVAMAAPPSVNDLEFPMLDGTPHLLHPRSVILSGAVSTPSDVLGFAHFPNLTVVGATLEFADVQFQCDGVVSAAVLQVPLASQVAAVSLERPPPATATPGEPLTPPPVVRVTAADGSAVAGAYVFATIVKEGNAVFALPPSATRNAQMLSFSAVDAVKQAGRSKALTHDVAGPTDPDGRATFRDMAFTPSGPAGAYALRFSAVGVMSAVTHDVQVASVVASVNITAAPTGLVHIWSGPRAWGSLFNASVAANASGHITSPLALQVRTARGAPVVGVPCRVAAESLNGGTASEYVVRELPYTGSRVTDVNGNLVISGQLTPLGAADLYDTYLAADVPSALRVLVGPSGTIRLRVIVDGVDVGAVTEPLTVVNHDPVTAASCALIQTLGMPSRVHVGQPSAGDDVVARAVNSHGVPLAGVPVHAHVVDAATYVAAGVTPGLWGVPQDSVTYWQSAAFRVYGPLVLGEAPAPPPWADASPQSVSRHAYSDTADPIPTLRAVTNTSGVAVLGKVSVPEAIPAYMRLGLASARTASEPSWAAAVGYRQRAPAEELCWSDASAPIDVASAVQRLEVLQSHSECTLGTPLSPPMRVRAVAADGSPVAHASGVLLLGVDEELTLFPPTVSAVDRDVFALPLNLRSEVSTGSWSAAVTDAGGQPLTTDAAGVLTLNVTFRHGFPGTYAAVPAVQGFPGALLPPITCANPVAALTVAHTVAAPTACPPTNSPPPFAFTPHTVRDGVLYAVPSACVPSDACSGHGTCACDVCVCDAGWAGAVDCSERSDVSLATLDTGSPVVHVGGLVPHWLLDDVTVTDGSGQPLAGYVVQAHLSRCDSETAAVLGSHAGYDLEPASGVPFTSYGSSLRKCRRPDGSLDTKLASLPSDVNGVARFNSTAFITGAPTGCYAFLYSFFTTSPGNFFSGVIEDPLRGAVLATTKSRPFTVLNPVTEVQVDTSRLPVQASFGFPLNVQPAVQLVGGDGGPPPPLPASAFCSRASLYQEGVVCPQQSGRDVLALARHVTTNAVYPLLSDFSGSACAVSDAAGRAAFSQLTFPRERFDGYRRALPVYQQVPPGTYRLVFQVDGVRAEAPTTFDVVTEPAVLELESPGVPADVHVGDMLPEVRVVAALRNGMRVQGVAVLATEAALPGARVALASGGVLARTGADGVAVFDSLRFVSGAPDAVVTLSFATAKAVVSVTTTLRNAATLTVSPPPSTVQFVEGNSVKMPGTLCLTSSRGDRIAGAALQPLVLVPPQFRCAPGVLPSAASDAYLSDHNNGGQHSFERAVLSSLSLDAPLVTAGDGCTLMPAVAVTSMQCSSRLAFIAEWNGVRSPPTYAVVLTRQDAQDVAGWVEAGTSPVTWLTVLTLLPLFVGNTTLGDKWVLAWVAASAVTVGFCVVLTTRRFVQEYSDAKRTYPKSETDYVLGANIVYVLINVVALALFAAVTVQRVADVLCTKRSVAQPTTAAAVRAAGGSSQRQLKMSAEAVWPARALAAASTSPVPLLNGASPQRATRTFATRRTRLQAVRTNVNFDSLKRQRYQWFAKKAMARAAPALIDNTGALEVATVRALTEVFSRYTDSYLLSHPPAWAFRHGCLSRLKSSCWFWLGALGCSTRAAPPAAALANAGSRFMPASHPGFVFRVMGPGAVARFNAGLLSIHTGGYSEVVAGVGVVGAPSSLSSSVEVATVPADDGLSSRLTRRSVVVAGGGPHAVLNDCGCQPKQQRSLVVGEAIHQQLTAADVDKAMFVDIVRARLRQHGAVLVVRDLRRLLVGAGLASVAPCAGAGAGAGTSNTPPPPPPLSPPPPPPPTAPAPASAEATTDAGGVAAATDMGAASDDSVDDDDGDDDDDDDGVVVTASQRQADGVELSDQSGATWTTPDGDLTDDGVAAAEAAFDGTMASLGCDRTSLTWMDMLRLFGRPLVSSDGRPVSISGFLTYYTQRLSMDLWPGAGITDDLQVWAELDGFGYSHSLGLRVTEDETGGGMVLSVHLLNALSNAVAQWDASGDGLLDYHEANAFLEAAGLPTLAPSDFTVATAGSALVTDSGGPAFDIGSYLAWLGRHRDGFSLVQLLQAALKRLGYDANLVFHPPGGYRLALPSRAACGCKAVTRCCCRRSPSPSYNDTVVATVASTPPRPFAASRRLLLGHAVGRFSKPDQVLAAAKHLSRMSRCPILRRVASVQGSGIAWEAADRGVAGTAQASESFVYPQRLLVALWLSLLVGFVGVFAYIALVKWLRVEVLDVWNDAEAEQARAVATLRVGLSSASVGTTAAMAAALQAFAGTDLGPPASATAVLDAAANVAAALQPAALVVNASDPAVETALLAAGVSAANIAMTLQQAATLSAHAVDAAVPAAESVSSLTGDVAVSQAALESVLASYLSLAGLHRFQDLRNQVLDNMITAGIVGAIVGYLSLIVTWVFIMRTYKRRMFDARQGRYPFRRDKVKLTRSVNLVGHQMSIGLLGQVLFSTLVGGVVFVLMWPSAVESIVQFGLSALAASVSVALVIVAVQRVSLDFVLTSKGQDIRHRALFRIADFAFSFLNIFKGAVIAITRLGILVAFFGLFFMRSDLTLLPLDNATSDPSAHAYFATLLADIRFNNPITWTFADLMERRLRVVRRRHAAARRRQAAASKGGGVAAAGDDVSLDRACRQRARNRWFLALTLLNNPSLLPHRRRGTHYGKTVQNFRLLLQVRHARRRLRRSPSRGGDGDGATAAQTAATTAGGVGVAAV